MEKPSCDEKIEKRLALARELAIKAGRKLKNRFRKTQDVQLKGVIDLVTAMDREAERLIVEQIKKAFPEDNILSEEEGGDRKKDRLWLIDPLDGTTNYAHGICFYSVSIAFFARGLTQLGVVYNPQLGELFYALKGKGAFLNDQPIRVSQCQNLDHCLVATGFPYDVRVHPENNLDLFARAQLHTRGVRRLGAASLDLAYTACGIFDAYWELRLSPWDVAAGALLVEEAGGKVTTLEGKKFTPFVSSYLASNGLIHHKMRKLLLRG